MQSDYDKLVVRLKEIGLLGSVSAVLGWDERTQLPNKGAEFRAEQLSLLAKLRDEAFTSKEGGDLLSGAEASGVGKDPESDAGVNLKETRRSYDRATKLPTAL